MIRRIIIFTTLIFLTVSTGYALDPVTHEAINETIATGRSEDFSLDDYLKNQLGFTNGITEVVYYKKIWQWIQLGGRYEDKRAAAKQAVRRRSPHPSLKTPRSKCFLKSRV